MKDRFTNGLMAGVLAAPVALAINWGAQAINLNTVVWADFMGLLILGRGPQDLAEIAFLIAIQIGLLGLLGALFALILPKISSKRHLLKGALFGTAVWFVLFSLPIVLQLGHLMVFPLLTAVVNLISSIGWGLALAFFLKWLDSRVEQSL